MRQIFKPDLAPSDFAMFGPLKEALSGNKFEKNYFLCKFRHLGSFGRHAQSMSKNDRSMLDLLSLIRAPLNLRLLKLHSGIELRNLKKCLNCMTDFHLSLFVKNWLIIYKNVGHPWYKVCMYFMFEILVLISLLLKLLQ